MLGDILTALTRYEIVVGALVAGALLLGFALLNRWQRWWVNSDLLAVERARADEARADADAAVTRAHADADAKVVTMRDAMKERSQQDREDGNARALQVRADLQAELDRQIRFIDALQRDIESWKTAWNLADQANREEDDARWDEIRAHMVAVNAAMVVMQRIIVVLQRNADGAPLELEASSDGGGPSGVF